MNDTNEHDLAAMSGEGAYRGSRPLELNEVSLNGDGDVVRTATGGYEPKGGYFRKKILIGKPKDEKPEEVKLGATISVVFLKIRRKLIERGKDGEVLRSTNEHNSKNDAVSLFEGKGKTAKRIDGVASDLRERYEGLRTVQIVYALLVGGTGEPELVRLIVKGASLGSEAKADEVTDFYSYLGSFRGEEHVWQYKTVLSAVREEGHKSYYAIDFKRGEALSEKSLEYAVEKLKEVHAKCSEIDATRAAKIAKRDVAGPEEEREEETVGGIEYPKDDINPDDIPF
jgi:hypothetical protein